MPWVKKLVDPSTGGPLDLTGATVTLYMWTLPHQSIVIDGGSCTHDDAGGTITYNPVLADVDEPGEFQCQFLVTLSNGKTKRYPDMSVDDRWIIKIGHVVESDDTQAS